MTRRLNRRLRSVSSPCKEGGQNWSRVQGRSPGPGLEEQSQSQYTVHSCCKGCWEVHSPWKRRDNFVSSTSLYWANLLCVSAFVFCAFESERSLSSPYWPGTHNPLASASWMLGCGCAQRHLASFWTLWTLKYTVDVYKIMDINKSWRKTWVRSVLTASNEQPSDT